MPLKGAFRGQRPYGDALLPKRAFVHHNGDDLGSSISVLQNYIAEGNRWATGLCNYHHECRFGLNPHCRSL
jgi:hypothetical protein